MPPVNSIDGFEPNRSKKGVRAMQWEFIVALVVAIPIILFPVAFIWYINIGGIYIAIKEARERRAIRKREGKREAATGEHIGITPIR